MDIFNNVAYCPFKATKVFFKSQDFGISGYLVVFIVIECGREILVALEGEGIGIILLLVLLLRVGILLLGGIGYYY